jgi:HK97 family phage major capsid protein
MRVPMTTKQQTSQKEAQMPQAVNDEPLKLGRQWRTLAINKREIDLEARTVPLSFSSEEPYRRWWGTEILGHGPGEVDMSWMSSGRAPLLADHDTRQQIGVILSAEIGTDRKGRAVAQFGKSPRAEQEWQDVVDGVRTNVSVGYEILELELVKQEGDENTYRVTKWMPLENSTVAIPADMTVGIGRSAEGPDLKPVRVVRSAALLAQEPAQEPQTPPAQPQVKEQPVTQDVIDKAAATAASEAQTAERARVQAIMALGTRHHLRELADKAVVEGVAVEMFRGLVLDELHKKGSNVPLEAPVGEIGLAAKEAKSFSLQRYLRSLAEKNPTLAAFEHECARTVAENYSRTGLKASSSGMFLPYDLMVAPMPGVRAANGMLYIGDRAVAAQRDLATSSLGAGGALVATNLDAANFITLLRAASLVSRMGARTLSGLVGNVDIPRMTGSVTAGWVAQGGAGTESDATFGKVSLSPKTVHAIQDITRDLYLQATPEIEGLLRMDMVEIMATQKDFIALHGTGAGNQPTGLVNTAGIGAEVGGTNGAAPTWDNLVNLESLVANNNAAVGSLGYLTNTKVRGKLKRTQKFASTNGKEIWDPAGAGDDSSLFGSLNGYRAGVSNNVRSDLTKGSSTSVCSALIFGNWADLLIGEWGSAEIMVDEVTQAANRIKRLHIWQTLDIAVRRGQSFSAMTDILTT